MMSPSQLHGSVGSGCTISPRSSDRAHRGGSRGPGRRRRGRHALLGRRGRERRRPDVDWGRGRILVSGGPFEPSRRRRSRPDPRRAGGRRTCGPTAAGIWPPGRPTPAPIVVDDRLWVCFPWSEFDRAAARTSSWRSIPGGPSAPAPTRRPCWSCGAGRPPPTAASRSSTWAAAAACWPSPPPCSAPGGSRLSTSTTRAVDARPRERGPQPRHAVASSDPVDDARRRVRRGASPTSGRRRSSTWPRTWQGPRSAGRVDGAERHLARAGVDGTPPRSPTWM